MTDSEVVLLHGVGLDRRMWAPVEGLLQQQGWSTRALDLLGHGGSGSAPAGTTLTDLAEPVAAQLAPGTHLVGFSLGALVAQHLAAHRPDLVATLTSVSSVCDRTADERDAVLSRLHNAEQDFAGSVAASLTRWYDGTDVPRAEVRTTESTLLANDRESYLACYRVFATGDTETALLLPGIAAPALAITGSDDPGSTPEMTQRIGAAMPRCRVVILPDTRHMLPVQRPRELVTELVALFKEAIS